MELTVRKSKFDGCFLRPAVPKRRRVLCEAVPWRIVQFRPDSVLIREGSKFTKMDRPSGSGSGLAGSSKSPSKKSGLRRSNCKMLDSKTRTYFDAYVTFELEITLNGAFVVFTIVTTVENTLITETKYIKLTPITAYAVHSGDRTVHLETMKLKYNTAKDFNAAHANLNGWKTDVSVGELAQLRSMVIENDKLISEKSNQQMKPLTVSDWEEDSTDSEQESSPRAESRWKTLSSIPEADGYMLIQMYTEGEEKSNEQVSKLSVFDALDAHYKKTMQPTHGDEKKIPRATKYATMYYKDHYPYIPIAFIEKVCDVLAEGESELTVAPSIQPENFSENQKKLAALRMLVERKRSPTEPMEVIRNRGLVFASFFPADVNPAGVNVDTRHFMDPLDWKHQDEVASYQDEKW